MVLSNSIRHFLICSKSTEPVIGNTVYSAEVWYQQVNNPTTQINQSSSKPAVTDNWVVMNSLAHSQAIRRPQNNKCKRKGGKGALPKLVAWECKWETAESAGNSSVRDFLTSALNAIDEYNPSFSGFMKSNKLMHLQIKYQPPLIQGEEGVSNELITCNPNRYCFTNNLGNRGWGKDRESDESNSKALNDILIVAQNW